MTKLTAENIGNLEKLATYLESLPADYEHFSMLDYYCGERPAADYALHNGGLGKCGAVACAVGHGPAAGILAPEEMVNRSIVDWNAYAGLFVGSYETAEYDWAFYDNWAAFDDTPHGAAARIRYMLAKGTPSGFSRRDIRDLGLSFVALYAPYRIDASAAANA